MGFSTLISDMRAGPRYLAVSFGRTVSDIEDPKALFSDADFVTRVIYSSNQNLESYIRALDFFQIEDDEHFLTSVIMSLSNSATLQLTNNTTLTSKDVTGRVWLRVIEKAGLSLVEATWRDSVGEVKSALVTSSEGLAGSTYKISFDSKAIENISIRTYNKDFHTW